MKQEGLEQEGFNKTNGQSLEKVLKLLASYPFLLMTKLQSLLKKYVPRAKESKKEQGNGELGLVVIDYVQLMDGQRYMECRDAELGRIVSDLKNMATQLNVPLLLMSQLSRDIEHRENKRPMLCDLRETQSLESDADMVVMIYREEYYHPETCDRGITELITCKHRNGPLGTVKLLFEPQFTRFRNLAA